MKPYSLRVFRFLIVAAGLTVSTEAGWTQQPGTIVTVAGNGNEIFSGDGGLAIGASLNLPNGIFVDGIGNLYIADRRNHRIRKVNLSGAITTVVGNGNPSFSGDGGLATQASLNFPNGVFGDEAGNLHIADQDNSRIRRVDPAGNITTVAGNGNPGFSGDSGLATQASLNFPSSVVVDRIGNLYIVDHLNNRIRKVDSIGIITNAN